MRYAFILWAMHKTAGISRPFLHSPWIVAYWFFICILFESCCIRENIRCHFINRFVWFWGTVSRSEGIWQYSNGWKQGKETIRNWNNEGSVEWGTVHVNDIWSTTKFCYSVLGLDLFDSISIFLGSVLFFWIHARILLLVS